MTLARRRSRLPATLALVFSFGIQGVSWAQRPGISTGSGAGTGTGTSAGSGLGTTGTGMESDAATMGPLRRGGYGPVPPGVIDPGARPGTRLPTDVMPPSGGLGLGLGGIGSGMDPGQLSDTYQRLLEQARMMDQPGERAMALERIARSAIFTNRLQEAHVALDEARQASLQEPARLIRDQRITATITTLLSLAESLVREGLTQDFLPEDEASPAPGRRDDERFSQLSRAEEEWERAAELATRLANRDFRSQMLHRTVDSQANGSQSIANHLQRTSLSVSPLGRQAARLNRVADRQLLLAAAHARLIDRPIWRDDALITVASNAAVSNQFERGLEIALTIPQPEARTDGLLRLAESQARRNLGEGATRAYSEAARAVASIPQRDPRIILAGVLIDSLISVGRFDDARSSIIFYPDDSNRVIALGAIAEAQGARGQSEAARAWIAREGPPAYRSYLNRKVNDGLLATLDRNRNTTFNEEGP